MSEPIRDLETAVRELGALPVPVGDQPLDDQRLAEIAERTPKRAAALTAWLNQNSPVDGQRALENAETVLAEDVPALLAEVQRLRAGLEEMTHLRDNALRALYRDDVEVDIDLEETIAAPFYGPGWDWDEGALQPVVREAAAAVRPAFAKLTQQRDQAQARVAELEKAAEQIRFLHKDSPMGPCPVCVDADAWARGDDPTVPYPCPTARLAGAKDFDPPGMRHAVRIIGPDEEASR